MATKKRHAKSRKTAGTKVAPMKKVTKKKEAAPKKAITKAKAGRKKTTGPKRARAPKKQVHRKSQGANTAAFAPEKLRSHSGEQSGDLQGLSHTEVADSESVNELLEEGNAFEADVVKGVEDVGDADEGEVRTHEVPEDDVPGEYRDKDE
jgi:hypothetical protein